MKWVLRIGIGLVVLVVLLLGVLLVTLPRLAGSDAARARIQQVARDATGSELRYEELDFGLFPPSLLVVDPSLSTLDAGADAEPIARADRVALRVEWMPLLQRRLEVSSLVVDGLALHLVRDADGIALPGPPPGAAEETPDAPPEDSGGAGGDEGLGLGIQRIALRDASLVLEDRTASPPATSRVEGIEAEIRASGGDTVTGEVEVARTDVAFAGVTVSGPLVLRLDEIDPASGAADFEFDADAAELAHAADFRKPAGTRARVRGVVVRDDAGALGVDDLEIALHELLAKGALRPEGEGFALHLAADPFELKGWETLVPALGLVSPRGRLAIRELVLTSPFAASHGRFAIDALEMRLPDSGPLSFSGDLVLAGASLFAREAKLLAAGQPFVVSPKLDGLDGSPRFELRFETAGADANALLSAFADLPDRLQGPLVAKGTLRGPLSGDAPLTQTLAGEVSLSIDDGRIVGASLLESALGSLGERLADVARARNPERWKRFTSDAFERLAADLRVGNGRLVAAPATLDYPDYGVRVEGPVRLSDLALDLRGALRLGPAVDAELARAFGAPDEYQPQELELVIESLRGTPSDPKVQIARSSAATLATHYAKEGRREDLRRAVEKELGPGTGEVVDRVLDGLLGGKR